MLASPPLPPLTDWSQFVGVISIFIDFPLIMYQMTMSNVRGVARSNEPTEHHDPTLELCLASQNLEVSLSLLFSCDFLLLLTHCVS